jgi:hypothetical protein
MVFLLSCTSERHTQTFCSDEIIRLLLAPLRTVLTCEENYCLCHDCPKHTHKNSFCTDFKTFKFVEKSRVNKAFYCNSYSRTLSNLQSVKRNHR